MLPMLSGSCRRRAPPGPLPDRARDVRGTRRASRGPLGGTARRVEHLDPRRLLYAHRFRSLLPCYRRAGVSFCRSETRVERLALEPEQPERRGVHVGFLQRAVYRLGWVGRAWLGLPLPAGAGALARPVGRSPIRTRLVSRPASPSAHLGNRDARPVSRPSLILTALRIAFPLLSISSILSSALAVRVRFSCAAVHRRRISLNGTSCPVFARTRPATRSTLMLGVTVPMNMASISNPRDFARRTTSGREFPEYVLSNPKSVFLLRCSSMLRSTSSRAACCFLGLFQSPRPLAMLSAL